MIYNEEEIARIGRVAFSAARKRRKKVCSVDKANVLAVSRVWREVMVEVGKPNSRMWKLPHLYVDNAAMQLVARILPSSTSNRDGQPLRGHPLRRGFRDHGLHRHRCLLASLGAGNPGLFEPIHGFRSRHRRAGEGHLWATIFFSAAMLLRLAFDMDAEACGCRQRPCTGLSATASAPATSWKPGRPCRPPPRWATRSLNICRL